MITREQALAYHSEGRPGKIKVVPTKPTADPARPLARLHPGVAEPCREIARDPDEVFRYTGRGNLVAVVTNGTAVLGLGNIGPLAGKPVMEGKAVLFKRFADIDVFDIEIDSQDPDEIVRTVPADRADLRRHQPRGHPRARVLRDREAADRDARHPGLPRRPARHRDHLGRGAAQRAPAHRPQDRRAARWCSPARARPASRARGSTATSACPRENITAVRQQGRDLRGPQRGHEPLQGGVRA